MSMTATNTIHGAEGLSPSEITKQVRDGARFVRFEYNLSLILWSIRRQSPVFFLKPGETSFIKSLPYSIISAVCGWWSFPFGLIATPKILARNFGGGHNVTSTVMASLGGRRF